MTDEYTSSQVAELKNDPNIDRVYEATAKRNFLLHKVFDYGSSTMVSDIEIEQGDDVFVTVDRDGTWYINFTSIYPNTYHFRSLGVGSMADNDLVEIPLPLKEL